MRSVYSRLILVIDVLPPLLVTNTRTGKVPSPYPVFGAYPVPEFVHIFMGGMPNIPDSIDSLRGTRGHAGTKSGTDRKSKRMLLHIVRNGARYTFGNHRVLSFLERAIRCSSRIVYRGHIGRFRGNSHRIAIQLCSNRLRGDSSLERLEHVIAVLLERLVHGIFGNVLAHGDNHLAELGPDQYHIVVKGSFQANIGCRYGIGNRFTQSAHAGLLGQ